MQEYIRKILGSGRPPSSASYNNSILIVSNNEIEGFIIIVKSLEDSGLLLKGFSETIQNEVKEQKRRFLSMLIGASLLGNILTGAAVIIAGDEAATKEKVKDL